MLQTQPKTTQPQTPPQSGKKIKNYIYHYSDLIGRGNFAKVYRGLNTLTQQIVAIKIVSLDALKSKRLQELIFEEIRILQQMNHPNVVKFYQALLSDRNCYIITELCNEGDLEDRIRNKKPFIQSELNKIILDIYHGLRYLRDMSVTHRDLKTANIFLHNGVAKIADFGLAKFYKERFKDLDIGSPLYMSPEGLIHNYYGEKTDVWAFGVIIYQLIHRQTPFCHCQTEADLKNSASRPIPQQQFNRNIHPQLRQLINCLLQINENKRPSIYEVAHEPYLKSLLISQFQSNKSIKKTYHQAPYNINQSITSPQQNPIQLNGNNKAKTGLLFRPASLESPKRNNNGNKILQQNQMIKIQVSKKEERKISFQNAILPKTIELGGTKSTQSKSTQQNQQNQQYLQNQQSKNNQQIAFHPKNRVTIEHPHLIGGYQQQMNQMTPYQHPMNGYPQQMNRYQQQMLHQQFSAKTIQTKQSQQQRNHFIRDNSISQNTINK